MVECEIEILRLEMKMLTLQEYPLSFMIVVGGFVRLGNTLLLFS